MLLYNKQKKYKKKFNYFFMKINIVFFYIEKNLYLFLCTHFKMYRNINRLLHSKIYTVYMLKS